MCSIPGLALAAFACGVCLLQLCPALSPWPWAIAIAGACALAAGRGSRPVAAAAALALGFGYAALRAENRLGDTLPREWEGLNVRITGVVDDLPALSERGARFAFAVETVHTPRARVPSRLSLGWYAPRDGENAAAPIVRAGERWTLTVRLRRPHGNVNPGGFDLEAWLLQQDLRATGYVVAEGRNERNDAFAGRSGDYVQRARERVRTRIEQALAGEPYAGVVVALAIGDQRAVPVVLHK